MTKLGVFHGVQLYIKRDELLHPAISGNKWRKLAPVLEGFSDSGYAGILSFGGAFSNHLQALAAAGKEYQIPTAAIVRGAAADLHNPTLRFVAESGTRIHRITKQAYDQGPGHPEVDGILSRYPGYLVLPEGGASEQAVQSCRTIATEILEHHVMESPLFVAVAAGSGTTAAGIVEGLGDRGKVLVFPATASGVQRSTISRHLKRGGSFDLVPDYDLGGFAAYTPELIEFIRNFNAQHGILLDPIYTGKMLLGIFDLIEQGYFPKTSTVVAVHTGGLQGWQGYCQRYGLEPITD